jgi:hypothetical protein
LGGLDADADRGLASLTWVSVQQGHDDVIPCWTVIITNLRLGAAITAVIAALAVTAFEISDPDSAACKAVIQAERVKAMASEWRFGAEPTARNGLPKAEVQRLTSRYWKAGKPQR